MQCKQLGILEIFNAYVKICAHMYIDKLETIQHNIFKSVQDWDKEIN